MASGESVLKQLKFWLAPAGFLLGAGFGAHVYLNQYAQAASVATHEARITALEVQSRNIEEDYHQVAQQLFEIARTVGATQIPLPEHRTENAVNSSR